ncbi:chitin synthase III catalytic subunit [Dipodascopsis tothii]|uniref:chitin synthase III catalytic subunit n=1 Tax=Dipodascopsis tothii TaxID=44089 RepID=UPI0034CF2222
MGFNNLDYICQRVPVPLCSLVGPYGPSDVTILGSAGVATRCYARSIDVANTVIFQVGAAMINIGALAMVAMMIFNVRSKYTAVGRKELTTFLGLYGILTVVSLLVDCGVVPPASPAYPYFVAIQNGLTSATVWCLVVNGFVGFQLYEDGTFLSLFLLRLISIIGFLITFVVSIFTFESWGSLGPRSTSGLFVVLYVINALCLVIYVFSQVVLVINTLYDRWPLVDIGFGVFFFVAGQILLYVFSPTLCDRLEHYLDGLFFATLCNLFGVMMIYKYWDSITREDLEFSVGVKNNMWDAKEVPDGIDGHRSGLYGAGPYGDSGSEFTGSYYALQGNRNSSLHY